MIASLIGMGVKALGGAVMSFFGYKSKKVDLSIVKETNDKDLQIAWWDYLKSQSDVVINRVIRPITMVYFIGDFIWQRLIHGTYKLVVIVPQVSIGDFVIGPITNGTILVFIIFFMFPLRSAEHFFSRKTT